MHKKGNAIKLCLTYVEVVGQECGGEKERSDEERKVSYVKYSINLNWVFENTVKVKKLCKSENTGVYESQSIVTD